MKPLAAGLALLVACSGLAAAEDRVLVILLDTYKNPQENLAGKKVDPPFIDGILKKLGFKDSQIKYLRNEQATTRNVLGVANSWLVDGVTKDDRVIFFYSGHGSQLPDDNGDENDGCDETLYVYDGHVRDDDLAKLFARVPAAETLALFDSCFSGTASRTAVGPLQGSFIARTKCNQAINHRSIAVGSERTDPTGQRDGSPGRGLIEFTAAQYNEVGWAHRDEGSFFTRSLYERLVVDGRPVSFSDLRDYAVKYVGDRVEFPDTPYKDAPTPSLTAPSAWLGRSVQDFGRLRFPPGQGAPDVDLPPPNLAEDPPAAFEAINASRPARLEFVPKQVRYKLGEMISYTVKSPIDGYLNVLEFSPDGTTTLLYPNKYDPVNRIRAGEVVALPGPSFGLQAIEPTGESKLLAVVTKQPANLYTTDLVPLEGGLRYAVTPEAFAALIEALKISTKAASGRAGVPTLTLNPQAFFASEVLDIQIVR